MYPGGVGVTGKSTVTESPATIVPAYGFAVEQVRLSGSFTLTVKAPAFTNWRGLPFAFVTAQRALTLFDAPRHLAPPRHPGVNMLEFFSVTRLPRPYSFT